MKLNPSIRAYFDAHGGQFSGSPITLTFAFRVKDDRIAALEIGS